ncbi:MAG: hypothetical protein LC109_12455 [Bacteroidia bacterium]|nr:hypothetical protein [Bacteroidia bacterium]
MPKRTSKRVIYLAEIAGELSLTAYKSLRQCCKEEGISYSTAKTRKKQFKSGGKIVKLYQIEIAKGIKRGKSM